VLFVVALGLLPHLRFRLLVGEPSCFFAAYDEDLYVLWAFTGDGPLLPHRWLSDLAVVLLSKLGGGSWCFAMAAADALFPAAGAVLAWLLAGRLTRRRLPRLVLALGLLFAQELFSLGCWTIWQGRGPLAVTTPASPVYDLRDLRAAAPAWLQQLWPDYASPFLTLFRTPEPQMSRLLLFAVLALLCGFSASRSERSPAPVLAALLAINLALFATYFFPAAAIVVLEALLCAGLLIQRRARPALVAGALALVGGASTLAGIVAYHGVGTAQGRSFPSRLPVITPSVLVAAAGLLALLTVLRRVRARDPGWPFAAACLASVLVMTNQQLVTGVMVSARDAERSVDYALAFLGAAIVGVWLARAARPRLTIVYAGAGALLALSTGALLRAQDRVFEQEFLVANLKSEAMRRAVAAVEAKGLRDARFLLEDPELGLMLQVRLERRIDHFLDITEVFLRPLPSLEARDGAWGVRSPHKRELFEYLARRGRTPGRLARLLEEEAAAGGGTLLWYLFDLADFWVPMTDGRRTRPERVREQLPALVADYERYLEAGDPCWTRPVVVLTRQSLAERQSERWSEAFLTEVTVGRDGTLMNMHAYLQTPSSGSVVAAPGECE
jgi:hypothetical protein